VGLGEARVIALLLALMSHALDLDEARGRAREQASAVELARADADAAQAEARAAFGANLPSLAGFANVTVGSGYTPIGFERPVPWQAGVGVRGTWTVVDPSRWAAATAARRTARGRLAMLDWTRAQARRDATVAYAEVQAAIGIAVALDQAAQDAERARSAVQELVQVGVRPPADGARARADALDLAAQAAQARGEVAASCARLQGLLDLPIDGRCTVEPVDWSAMVPGQGPDSHPALDAFAEAVGAARASAQSATLSQLPSVSLEGTAAEYAVPDRTGPGWSATLGLEVPLTAPTTGLGQVATARALRVRAQAELDQQERDLSVARVQALARLAAAREVLGARIAGREAAEEAWDRVDARFQQGLEDLTTWLTARRARIEASVAAERASAELAGQIAAVEVARGVE
jgi:outer membrane protein TolC